MEIRLEKMACFDLARYSGRAFDIHVSHAHYTCTTFTSVRVPLPPAWGRHPARSEGCAGVVAS